MPTPPHSLSQITMKFLSLASLSLSVASALVLPTDTSPVADASTLTARGGYPYAGQCSGIDKWGMTKCQCTSYVAWCLNQAGIAFTYTYDGADFYDANTWDDQARSVGLTVDYNPSVGSVAQTDAGQFGHVAYVVAVNGNTITVQEYNFNVPNGYDSRTVDKSMFQNFIHF